MNIILISRKLSRARSLNISRPQLAFAAFFFLLAAVAFSAGLFYLVARFLHAPSLQPYFAQIVPQPLSATYPLEGADAMAVKLGQIEAQLVRLDTLGQRLAKVAGFKPQELVFSEAPGRGGRFNPAQSDLTLQQINEFANSLSWQLEDRSDKLNLLESVLNEEKAKKQLTPSSQPVRDGWFSSAYGWRVDPFTGRKAFHEGVDFSANAGAPIYAAAGGIVLYSAFHPQYGNMVEVDHGSGLVTRYAHAQKRLVKMGDVVMKGSKIAEVGSTGRSTGAHLHFEVLHKGAPQNPSRFLRPPS
jgi:murein DD-endopeptidase MepM/ murein hydrolase activator NlpD